MSHFYLVHPLIRKINEKKIEKKINIDLAVLPSHDKMAKLIFIFLFFSFLFLLDLLQVWESIILQSYNRKSQHHIT